MSPYCAIDGAKVLASGNWCARAAIEFEDGADGSRIVGTRARVHRPRCSRDANPWDGSQSAPNMVPTGPTELRLRIGLRSPRRSSASRCGLYGGLPSAARAVGGVSVSERDDQPERRDRYLGRSEGNRCPGDEGDGDPEAFGVAAGAAFWQRLLDLLHDAAGRAGTADRRAWHRSTPVRHRRTTSRAAVSNSRWKNSMGVVAGLPLGPDSRSGTCAVGTGGGGGATASVGDSR